MNVFGQLSVGRVFAHEFDFIYLQNSAPPRSGFHLLVHKLSGQAQWRLRAYTTKEFRAPRSTFYLEKLITWPESEYVGATLKKLIVFEEVHAVENHDVEAIRAKQHDAFEIFDARRSQR